MIKLEKPIAFFDLETTGVDVAKDKIVSIAILKLLPDGRRESKYTLINPSVSIPKDATKIHGITDEMVKDSPSFKAASKELFDFFDGCDLGGFNCIHYDIPLIAEEFLRCDLVFPKPDMRFVDACTIYRQKEERTLSAGYKFYCGKTLDNAHNAQADIEATVEIFLKQTEKYEDLREIGKVFEFCHGDNRVDFAGKIIRDGNGDYVYNFGKDKGKRIKDDPSFAKWMLSQSFLPKNTKTIVQRILEELNIPTLF